MSDQHWQEATDLVDRASEWGSTVSERKARKGVFARLLLVAAFLFLALGSILILPVLAGSLLDAETRGSLQEVAVIGFFLVVAMAFKMKSGNLPRNALQIDYRACELRLGAERRDGTFIREQNIGFREIEEVYVDDENPDGAALCLKVPGETVTLHFHEAEEQSLHDLARKIAIARESALRAPVRSRIQSRIMGFEASFREAKQRIRTRIVTRTAD